MQGSAGRTIIALLSMLFLASLACADKIDRRVFDSSAGCMGCHRGDTAPPDEFKKPNTFQHIKIPKDVVNKDTPLKKR